MSNTIEEVSSSWVNGYRKEANDPSSSGFKTTPSWKVFAARRARLQTETNAFLRFVFGP